MSQITLRGLEPELEAAVRTLAAREGISLNKAALKLIRKGADLPAADNGKNIGTGLNDWVGCMTTVDAEAVVHAVDELDTMSLDQP